MMMGFSTSTRARKHSSFENSHGTNKKLKVATIPVDRISLPRDIYSKILEFLDPLTMLQLVSTSKEISQQLTYHLVIQSTMLRGTARAVLQLQSLLSVMEWIHKPSPTRMLRLSNGVLCEMCLVNRTHTVRCGLLLCWRCRKTQLHTFTKAEEKQLLACTYLELRPHGEHHSEQLTVRKSLRSIDNSSIGPIFSHALLKKMVRDDITSEEYLEDHEDSIQVSDSELLIRLRAQAHITKHQRETEETNSRNIVPQWIRDIKQIFNDAKLNDEWNDFLETHVYNLALHGPKGRWLIRMSYRLSNDLLGMYLGFLTHNYCFYSRPSARSWSSIKEHLRGLPHHINSVYDDIAASGVINFTCFALDRHPLERTIRLYLDAHYIPGDAVLKVLDMSDLLLIRQGNAKDVLLQLVFGDHFCPLFDLLFATVEKTAIPGGAQAQAWLQTLKIKIKIALCGTRRILRFEHLLHEFENILKVYTHVSLAFSKKRSP